MPIEFFIPFNTPSSKNSRINTVTDEGSFSFPSKVVQRWNRRTKKYWINQQRDFFEAIKDLSKPLFIHMVFIRDSKRRFDYTNVAQIITDSMVKYKWIEDDDSINIVPVFGKPELNKEKAGVILKILAEKPVYKFL